MKDLSSVLLNAGLGHCLSALEEDDVDLDCLLLLTEDDMKDLAISDSDKTTLLKTIIKLRSSHDRDITNEIGVVADRKEVNDFLFDDEICLESNKKQNKIGIENTSQSEVDSQLFEQENEHVNQAFVKMFEPSPSQSPSVSFPSISRRFSQPDEEVQLVTNNIVVTKELVPRDGLTLEVQSVKTNIQARSLEIVDTAHSGSVSAIHRLSPPPPPLASPAAILEVTSSLGKDDTTFESWLASQETKYAVPKGRAPRPQFSKYIEQRKKARGKSGTGALPSLSTLNASYSEPRINVAIWESNDVSSPMRGSSRTGRVGFRQTPVQGMSSNMPRNNPMMANIPRNNSAMLAHRNRLSTPQLGRLSQTRVPQRGLPPRSLNGNWASRQGSLRSNRRPPPPSQLPKLTLSKSAPC